MLKKSVTVAAVMAAAAFSAWAGDPAVAVDKVADKSAEKVAEKKTEMCKAGDTVYTCAHCGVMDAKAGKCSKCKGDLAAVHVLGVKDGKASCCACEAACKCTVKADDPKQCTCGKAVTTLECPLAAEKAKTDADKAKPKDHPAH